MYNELKSEPQFSRGIKLQIVFLDILKNWIDQNQVSVQIRLEKKSNHFSLVGVYV